MYRSDDEQIRLMQMVNSKICEQLGVSYEALKALRHLPPFQAAQILKLSRVHSTFSREVTLW